MVSDSLWHFLCRSNNMPSAHITPILLDEITRCWRMTLVYFCLRCSDHLEGIICVNTSYPTFDMLPISSDRVPNSRKIIYTKKHSNTVSTRKS